MKNKCENTEPKITIENGYKCFCCEEHAKEFANKINNKKTKKFSKSDQKE